jgi:hypothetical protein
MIFNIKRLIYAISKRKLWLLFILLPAIIYLTVSAGTADRLSIQQKISISKELVLVSGQERLEGIKDFVSRPDEFFLNNFAVRKLYTELYPGTAVYRSDLQFRNLLNTIKDNMFIKMPAENMVMITFYGQNKEIGQTVVNYYSQRFIQKVREGLARSPHKQPNVKLPVLVGNLEIKAYRSLWRSERLVPLLLITFISLSVILVILVIGEWSDPSFKSERQIAQYLELPILGSLPDLNKVAAALNSKREI